jgi:DNA-binding MarR family transcriptional regulator
MAVMSTSDPQAGSIVLGLLLRRAHRLTAAALAATLAPMGLSGRHFGVLLMLDMHGVSSQKELIAALGSDKAGMVRTVDDLDRHGYLERLRSSTDRRLYELTLTPAGRAALADARTRAAAATKPVFGCLTDDEQAILTELLSRIVNAP